MMKQIQLFIISAMSRVFGKKRPRASTLAKAAMLLLLPLAMFVASCGHQHGAAEHDHEAHDHHAVEAEGSHHHGGDAGPMTLNNGAKWEADEHTLSVVKEMKSGLSDFEKAGKENYPVLADSLTSQLSVLVAGCTMTGPAHDELHKWLVPFTENVKDLKASQNASSARGEVQEIKKTLDTFDDFFEGKAAN